MLALGESKFIEIGNRRLHYCKAGSGALTVIFEAGLGKSRNTWSWVQPDVARFAQTIVYDRAGYGLSDPVDDRYGKRPIKDLVTDHEALLSAVDTEEYILVGHSYGGPIVRKVALDRPDRCVGLVLVDEVSETCDEIVSGEAMRGASGLYSLQIPFARLGLLSKLLSSTYYRGLASPALDEIRREEGSPKHARAARAEWRAMLSSLARIREEGPWRPAHPITTISARRRPNSETDFIARSHAESIRESVRGRHIFAETRSHYTQLREPQLVVDEIHNLVKYVSRTPPEYARSSERRV